jgi:hypothetical protein
MHDLIVENGYSYRVLEDLLSLPDLGFQKGLECISDDNEALRQPDTT